MKLFWGSFNNDERKIYERMLVDACKLASNNSKSMVSSITVNDLLDMIIAAERNQLKDLLSAAIELASKCGFEHISTSKHYDTLSSSTKFNICSQRFKRMDNYYSRNFSRGDPTKTIANAYRPE